MAIHVLKPNFTKIVAVNFEAVLSLLFQKKSSSFDSEFNGKSIANLTERAYRVTICGNSVTNSIDEYTALSSKY